MTDDPLVVLARLIERRSGFVIPERGHRSLARLAKSRFEALSLPSIEHYVEKLQDQGDTEEWRELMSAITIKESFLFRGRSQFEALEQIILPELSKRCTHRGLQVWCAGCARGEEAATLAIVLAECDAVKDLDWKILATDVDENALVEARKGRFGKRSVETVPQKTLDRHFSYRDGFYELSPDLLSRIQFVRLNLAQPSLNPPGSPFNLVFLRNVLIYFRPDLQRRVVASVETALDKNGWLFLGPSESLLPLDVSLKPRDLGGAFCYGWPGTELKKAPETRSSKRVGEGVSKPTGVSDSPQQISLRAEDDLSLNDRIETVVAALLSGETPRALGVARLLRREFPVEPIVLALEGLARARSGDNEGAVLAYRGALYLAPELFEVRFLLARVFSALGRRRRARLEFNGVLTALEATNRKTGTLFSNIGVPAREEISRLLRQEIIEIET